MTMTTDDLIQKHWNYYLMLEQKVLETRNYVEFRAENNNTSSNEFGLLMISIGAELDNFLKTYCEVPEANRGDRNINIGFYTRYLSQHYPQIAGETITILDTDPVITLSPFSNLNTPSQFPWWDAYNAVKHNRFANFTEAKLENVINLLSALYLLEMKMFKNIAATSTEESPIDCPLNQSKMFALRGWEFNCIPGNQIIATFINKATVPSEGQVN